MFKLSIWLKNRGKKTKWLILPFFFMFMVQFSYVQEAITATGGDASGGGGSVSYTIGQVGYVTIFGTPGSVAPGVQQAYEISVITGVPQAVGVKLTITAYPNPTTDLLILSVDNYDVGQLSYRLYDINGRLLAHDRLGSNKTLIDMKALVPATYLLCILNEAMGIKTLKIIKK